VFESGMNDLSRNRNVATMGRMRPDFTILIVLSDDLLYCHEIKEVGSDSEKRGVLI
jgi:hypothetical protein